MDRVIEFGISFCSLDTVVVLPPPEVPLIAITFVLCLVTVNLLKVVKS